jgi:hypothetical protein
LENHTILLAVIKPQIPSGYNVNADECGCMDKKVGAVKAAQTKH